jgi:hypothetical protein
MRPSLPVVLCAAVVLACAAPAAAGGAPGDSGVRVSASMGAAIGRHSTSPVVTGAVGYQVNRFASFELEFGYYPKVDLAERQDVSIMAGLTDLVSSLMPGVSRIYPPVWPATTPTEGHLMTVLANFVVHIPTRGSSVQPYLVIGGGVGSAESPQGQDYLAIPVMGYGMDRRGSMEGHGRMDSGLAMAGGGGVDVRIGGGISAGIDARYLYVARDPQAISLARVGARVGWRF